MYSAFPGKFATPILGATAALLVGSSGTLALAGDRVGSALVIWLGAVAVSVAGWWLARAGVLRAPLLRAQGVNLECARPGEAPTVWLCAHLDTKSQPLPTLVRSAALMVEGVGVVTALVLAALSAGGVTVHEMFWAFAGVVTLAGAVPVGLSMVGSNSPGALDNASGVATVIAAARQLQGERGVGVLISDAEELGLAGARAWARGRSGAVVLNCDGVDDGGMLTVMYSGRRPDVVCNAVAIAARHASQAVSVGRLFPGVLADSVAFSDAGLSSVTVSRGSVASLGRVHSRRDDLTRLTGAGIDLTASVLAAAARRILDTAQRP